MPTDAHSCDTCGPGARIMKPAARLLVSTSIIAGAAYLLDAAGSRYRRRTMQDDRYASATTEINERTRGIRGQLSHLVQRFTGQAQSLFKRDKTGDAALARRVRATLERAVSHPQMLGVSTYEGHVFLHGEILLNEHDPAVRAVRALEGVTEVADHLTDRKAADGAWPVRGSPAPKPQRFDLMQEHWSPGARILTGLVASALITRGVLHRSVFGAVAAVVGGSLLVRSATDIPLARLTGAQRLGKRWRAVDIHHTIIVDAPVERVFSVLGAIENFPAFMSNIREVMRPADGEAPAGVPGDGESHWVMAGPAGMSIEWDAVTTVNRPNEILAWHSVIDAPIEHSGIIRLKALGKNCTRLDIQMSYCPPVGALGHAVARMFRADARTVLEEDLKRLKRFIEMTKPASTSSSAMRGSVAAGSAQAR
jgi:uncharacterized membrane protein